MIVKCIRGFVAASTSEVAETLDIANPRSNRGNYQQMNGLFLQAFQIRESTDPYDSEDDFNDDSIQTEEDIFSETLTFATNVIRKYNSSYIEIAGDDLEAMEKLQPFVVSFRITESNLHILRGRVYKANNQPIGFGKSFKPITKLSEVNYQITINLNGLTREDFLKLDPEIAYYDEYESENRKLLREPYLEFCKKHAAADESRKEVDDLNPEGKITRGNPETS